MRYSTVSAIHFIGCYVTLFGQSPIFAEALTLGQALNQAETQNPDVLAAKANTLRIKAQTQTAGAIPNPELGVSFEELASRPKQPNAPAFSNLKVEIGQPIELGGKRSARLVQAAVLERSISVDQSETLARIRYELSSTFVHAYVLQQTVALVNERWVLANQLHKAAIERVRVGKVAPIEEIRVRSNALLALSAVDEKKQELKFANQRLSALMGQPEIVFKDVTYPLEIIFEPPSIQDLERNLDSAAVVQKSRLEFEKAKADVAVEDSKTIGNVTLKVDANYQPTDTQYLFGAGFNLPLPLFDRNQGNRASAASHAVAASALAGKGVVLAKQEFAQTYSEMATALKKSRFLKTDVLPGLEQTFKAFESAYRIGRVGYLDAVGSQESLFAIRESYLSALEQFHVASFKLKYLTAQTEFTEVTK